MYGLPTSVEVHGRQFHIRQDGDYRMVLDCFAALRDSELSEDEKVLASLLIFYNEFNDLDELPNDNDLMEGLIKEMFNFMNCGEEEMTGAMANQTVVDWEKDEKIIVSAINVVAQKEIRAEPYMHWWTFMSYYMGIGESLFATVTSIRLKLNRHEKLEKWEEKFKKDNPQYFVWKNIDLQSTEQQAILNEIWNTGR